MLPKLIAPEHEVKLFSLPKPVKFRPYLVKEEKLFLMAQQSDDPKDVDNTVRQVIRNCTYESVNVDTLPTFDLEYLFLQLRARSVSNKVEVAFICINETDDKKCNTRVPLDVDLNDVKLVVPDGHTNKFWLTDDIGVTLKYPTQPVVEASGADLLNVLVGCLETVFTKTGEVSEVSQANHAETQAFVESLTLQQTETLRTFFDTMPRLELKLAFKCPKCNFEDTLTLTGLQDFFD